MTTRSKYLSVLLTLMIIGVIGPLLLQAHWSSQIILKGPISLTADHQGGYFLALDDELIHYDATDKPQARFSLAQLGIEEISSIFHDQNGVLWIQDSIKKRPFKCVNLPECHPFGPSDLTLSRNIEMASDGDGGLAISDNVGHRILFINKNGEVVEPISPMTFSYPNQITEVEGGYLIANTNLKMIRFHGQAGSDRIGHKEIALGTDERPYRFIKDGENWWVLESGISLTDAQLRFYDAATIAAKKAAVAEKPNDDTLARQDTGTPIAVPANDLVGLIRVGDDFIITSRSDWKLIRFNPTTLKSTLITDAALQKRATEISSHNEKFEGLTSLVPYVMGALLLPLIIAAVVVDKKYPDPNAKTKPRGLFRRPEAATEEETPNDTGSSPSTVFPSKTLLTAHMRKLYIVGAAMLVMFGGMWLLLASSNFGDDQNFNMMSAMIFLPIFIVAIMFIGFFYTNKKILSMRYEFTPQKVFLFQGETPKKYAYYKDVYLTPGLFVIGDHMQSLDVAKSRNQNVVCFFHADIKRALEAHGASDRIFDTHKAYLKQLWKDKPGRFIANFIPQILIALVLFLHFSQIMGWFSVKDFINAETIGALFR